MYYNIPMVVKEVASFQGTQLMGALKQKESNFSQLVETTTNRCCSWKTLQNVYKSLKQIRRIDKKN